METDVEADAETEVPLLMMFSVGSFEEKNATPSFGRCKVDEHLSLYSGGVAMVRHGSPWFAMVRTPAFERAQETFMVNATAFSAASILSTCNFTTSYFLSH